MRAQHLNQVKGQVLCQPSLECKALIGPGIYGNRAFLTLVQDILLAFCVVCKVQQLMYTCEERGPEKRIGRILGNVGNVEVYCNCGVFHSYPDCHKGLGYKATRAKKL